MLLLTTAIVLALFLDILLRQKLLKRPVLRVAAPGCKPERRPYTVQQGGNAMISRHSAAVLMHGEDGAYHIFDNGCDTVLRRGTVLTLSDSGEQITVRKHPAAMPFTVLVVCVLLFLRLVPLPVMRHMLIKPAYEKLTFREPDYHWVSGDSLTPDQLAREDDIYNLLLIGTDGRGTLEPRADTMLLVSCNRRTRKLSVVSLLRDLRVQGYDPNALTVQEAAQARGLTPDDPNYAILAQMLKNDGQYRYMKLNETFTLTDDNAADAEERYLSACRSLLMNIEYTFCIHVLLRKLFACFAVKHIPEYIQLIIEFRCVSGIAQFPAFFCKLVDFLVFVKFKVFLRLFLFAVLAHRHSSAFPNPSSMSMTPAASLVIRLTVALI